MLRYFTTIAATACLLAGCSCSETSTDPPRKLRPGLKALLEHFDAHYDPQAEMLEIPFHSPGYHSSVETGRPVHPTRESLIYAVALLERDKDGDARRAARIVEKVVSLQDTDDESPTWGVWPWLLEEPLEDMAAPDLNWADFCGVSLAHMLVKHSAKLPERLRGRMKQSLRLAAEEIRRRDVQPDYTNIAVLGGEVCAAAGEILDDDALLDYGRERLRSVVSHTKRHGGFSEYNSPPYTLVVIAECERTRELVEDADTRQAAEWLRRHAWKTAAESFHPGTSQWAGPHSRTSRDRIRNTTADFLSRRTGVTIPPHPTMQSGEPRGLEVVTPLKCPDDFLHHFADPPSEPYTLERTFIKGRTTAASAIGTTWFSPDACLGSVNRSTFWTQRKPLIGYWKTDEDPAVVFRLRFLHDGRDFASMAVQTVQHDNRAVSRLAFLPNRGVWHPTLDRPEDGLFRATDFRLRYELRGRGVTVTDLGTGSFELAAGDYRIVIHTRPATFAGEGVHWEPGREGDAVYLDGICYRGKERAFDLSKETISLSARIELLGPNDPLATEAEWQQMEGE
jgi:hypothetical protein